MISQPQDLGKKLDEEFVLYMLEIEQRYQDEAINLSRHDRLRVEQWSSLLCQVNPSPTWKRNRNLYTSLLLNEIVTHGKLDR